jgi:hypothetical protein
VCGLGRKAEQYDLKIFAIKELIDHVLEFMLLMCVMPIQSEEDWNRIIDAPCPCKWHKDKLNLGDAVGQICTS